MSKARRNREQNAEKQSLKREREEFAAKKAKVRKITAIITASILAAVILIGLCGIGIYNHRLNSGEYLRSEVAASSKTIEVNGAMMNYYYNDVLNSFVDYYGSYVQYYGFDPTASAKYQSISDGESWFDYFMSGAKDNVTGYLALNEAAAAEGIVLSDAELAALETRVKNIDEALYGRGVKSSDILDAKSIEALAYKYQNAKQTEFAPTDAEIDERYESAPYKYQSVDFLAYSFDWSEGAISKENAALAAERFANAKNSDEFKSLIAEFIKKDSPDMSDETLEQTVASYEQKGALYTDGSELSEWAFTKAAVGDTKVITDESSSVTTIYMLTSAPIRDESKTVNVRHILFTEDKYGSLEKAKKKAEEILAEFESGDRSPESFALLALAWTEDENTCYNGGLYEDLAEGITLANFDDWCFYGDRKPGDCEIIQTTSGIHIVYFESSGRENWAASVADDIISERFSELSATLLSDYPVSFDDKLISSIPG